MRNTESHASGLGQGEQRTHHLISRFPGTTQQEISRKFGVNKAATARQCASLEEKGLIYRTANENDGRSKLLFPTRQAELLKNKADSNAEHAYDLLMAVLTSAEKEELTRLVNKICESIPGCHR